MKNILVFLICLTLVFCTPKGPKTYKSSFVGQTKTNLIQAKGIAKEIKVFGNTEAYIYKAKEEYYGKSTLSKEKDISPKKSFIIEHIYYINEKGIVYKYQVWKKKLKKTKNQQ
ncbi:MAG: hypothetical protein HRT73_06230 [Flavobacteriales bacterium]|nr:hypothetical protein [Flavobacteriales bacterium]